MTKRAEDERFYASFASQRGVSNRDKTNASVKSPNAQIS